MSIPAGERDYRLGGLERLHEAGLLLKDESFAGGVYLAGRAVEGMLRAIIWKSDVGIRTGQKSLETGHSLRDMLHWLRTWASWRRRSIEIICLRTFSG